MPREVVLLGTKLAFVLFAFITAAVIASIVIPSVIISSVLITCGVTAIIVVHVLVDVDTCIYPRPVVRNRVVPCIVPGVVSSDPISQTDVVGAQRLVDVIFIAANETGLTIEQVKRGNVCIKRRRLPGNLLGLLLNLA